MLLQSLVTWSVSWKINKPCSLSPSVLCREQVVGTGQLLLKSFLRSGAFILSPSLALSSVLDMVNFCALSFYRLTLKSVLFLLRKNNIFPAPFQCPLQDYITPRTKLTRNCIQHLLVVLFNLCLKGTWCHWHNSESGRCLHVPFHCMVSPVTSDGTRCKK